MTKKIIYILLLSAISFGAFYYGGLVGWQQSALNQRAFEAARLSGELETFKPADGIWSDHELRERDEKEAKINRHIIYFGYHLENELPLFPPFLNWREGNYKFMERAVSYRKQNPRIFKGVKYNPMHEKWREIVNDEVFQSSISYMDQSYKNDFLVSSEAEIEEKQRQYNLAMRYFGE